MPGTAKSAGGPVGVVLAGGAGRRLGGGKALVPLGGRPLIAWPLAALDAVLDTVAVVAKADSVLPPLGAGVELWLEPSQPRHPLTGILEALRRADGRAVLVCALDLPLVDAGVVSRLAADPGRDAPAVVARAGDRVQPLLARYEPRAGALLGGAGSDARLTEVVLALRPRWLEVPAGVLLNVNRREDLLRAEAAISRR